MIREAAALTTLSIVALERLQRALKEVLAC
jgi:hypothetical protein